MIFRSLDALGDWEFGRGRQTYATGVQALILDVATRLRSWVGDCFFDKTAGVDWTNLLNYNQATPLKNAIKAQILKTAGVINIRSLEFSTAGRLVTINAFIDTIYGSNINSRITHQVS